MDSSSESLLSFFVHQGCQGYFMEFLSIAVKQVSLTNSATQSSEVMKHTGCPEDVTRNIYLPFVFHSAAET